MVAYYRHVISNLILQWGMVDESGSYNDNTGIKTLTLPQAYTSRKSYCITGSCFNDGDIIDFHGYDFSTNAVVEYVIFDRLLNVTAFNNFRWFAIGY